MKIDKISKIRFIRIVQVKSLIGFITCLINDYLELGSIGVHTKLGGGFRLTFPSRKLRDGRLDFFFRFTDSTIEKQLTEAITNEIDRLGLFKFKTNEEDELKVD